MLFYQSNLAARLYDLQHQDDPILQEEEEFLLNEVSHASGPILDLGCGTGRILIPGLMMGADIFGCDGSLAFLNLLRKKTNDVGLRPAVFLCNLENIPLPSESFGLAFAAFRTFDHLVAPGSQERFLKEAHRILMPNAKLTLNTANPDPLDLEAALGQKVLLRDDLIDPETRRQIIWWGATRFDQETGLLHESSVYDFVQTDGQVAQSWYFSFTMRWRAYEEMVNMIEESGFSIEKCEGSFDGEPFEIGTGEAIWHLRKK